MRQQGLLGAQKHAQLLEQEPAQVTRITRSTTSACRGRLESPVAPGAGRAQPGPVGVEPIRRSSEVVADSASHGHQRRDVQAPRAEACPTDAGGLRARTSRSGDGYRIHRTNLGSRLCCATHPALSRQAIRQDRGGRIRCRPVDRRRHACGARVLRGSQSSSARPCRYPGARVPPRDGLRRCETSRPA